MQLMVLKESKKLGIDNGKASWDQFMEKFNEEVCEVYYAEERENKENLQEEIIDVMQMCIGILDKLEGEGYSLREGLNKHHKKINLRGWTSKKMINFTINDWEGK